MIEKAGSVTPSFETTTLSEVELFNLQNQIRQSKFNSQYHPSEQEKVQFETVYQQYSDTPNFLEKINTIHSLAKSLGITDTSSVDYTLKSGISRNLRATNKIAELSGIDKITIADAAMYHFRLTLESFIRMEPEISRVDQSLVFRVSQNPHWLEPDIYEHVYLKNKGDDYTYPHILRKTIMKFMNPEDTIAKKREIYYQILQDPEISAFNISKFQLRKIVCDCTNPKQYILENSKKFLRKHPRIRSKQETYTFKKTPSKKCLFTTNYLPSKKEKNPQKLPPAPRQNLELIPESHPQYQKYLSKVHPLLNPNSVKKYFSQFPNAPEIIEADIKTYDSIDEEHKGSTIFGIEFIIAESVRKFHQNATVCVDKYIQIMTNKNPNDEKTLYEKYDNIPQPTFISIISKYFFEETINVPALIKALEQESNKW